MIDLSIQHYEAAAPVMPLDNQAACLALKDIVKNIRNAGPTPLETAAYNLRLQVYDFLTDYDVPAIVVSVIQQRVDGRYIGIDVDFTPDAAKPFRVKFRHNECMSSGEDTEHESLYAANEIAHMTQDIRSSVDWALYRGAAPASPAPLYRTAALSL